MTVYRVAIGIMAFAHPHELTLTLHSVARLRTPNLTTYLLQNGMPDADFARVVAAYPWVVAISNPVNLGAAGGRNRLIDLVLSEPYDYLCFLDSDAWIAPDALDKLLSIYPKLDQPGLLACLVRETDRPERVHSSGISFDEHTLQEVYHTDIPPDAVVERQVVITTAAIISGEVLRQVPRLDERIFAYWEDVDWCLQMGLIGYKHYVVREAIAFHTSRSRFHPAVNYYLLRNHLLVASKFGGTLLGPATCRLALRKIIGLIHHLLALTPLSITCLLAAFVACGHVIRGRWGIAPAWMRQPPEQFLEYRLYQFLFRPERVAIWKRIFG